MPKKLEAKLRSQAKRKGFGKARTRAYVFGTLRKTGRRPRQKKRR